VLSGTTALFTSFLLLVAAAWLAHDGSLRRRLAVSAGVGAALTPWLIPAEASVWRGGLAIWTTWCCGRVLDLTRDGRDRPFGRRFWHVFAVIDTRQTTWASPMLDLAMLGKALIYATLAMAGLAIVSNVAAHASGGLYWVVRWAGGAVFFYCLADAVEGGVRALYRAAGVVAPRQHLVPIVSCSVQEFWGKRWNRAVGSWLRAHCFLPLARQGRVRLGLAAAFCASAVFHAYFTLVAVGWAMAGAMLVFFLIQGVFVLFELLVGVARWQPAFARAWTVIAVLGCSPLFIEPILRILLGER
jgi:Membrane bound O-acyl transferase family